MAQLEGAGLGREQGISQIGEDRVSGSDGLVGGSDGDGAVATGCLDEFPDAPAGLVLNPVTDHDTALR